MTPNLVPVAGHQYLIVPLAATPALKVQTKLARVLGESASKLAAGVVAKLGNGALDGVLDLDLSNSEDRAKVAEFAGAFLPSLDSAVSALVNRLDDDEVIWIVKTLLIGCQRDGKTITADTFERIYSRNTGELWAAVFACLKDNYGPLLEGLLTGASGITSASEPSTESNP